MRCINQILTQRCEEGDDGTNNRFFLERFGRAGNIQTSPSNKHEEKNKES